MDIYVDLTKRFHPNVRRSGMGACGFVQMTLNTWGRAWAKDEPCRLTCSEKGRQKRVSTRKESFLYKEKWEVKLCHLLILQRKTRRGTPTRHRNRQTLLNEYLVLEIHSPVFSACDDCPQPAQGLVTPLSAPSSPLRKSTYHVLQIKVLYPRLQKT